MSWKPDVCIYHYPCLDGFTAAWAVWKRFGDSVEFVPKNYGMKPPKINGGDILIVDFSYPEDVLKMMSHSVNRIVVLDHHKTAEAQLKNFPTFNLDENILFRDEKVLCHFDMNKSGAGLAWDFCFSEKTRPTMIDLVEDRDLWRWKYKDTKLFHASINSHNNDFITWDNLAENPTQTIEDGVAINRYSEKIVKSFIDEAYVRDFAGYENIPIANVPYIFSSDVGNGLLKENPTSDFAVTYYHARNGISYSLRSEEGRVDVSKIAEKYGGGGHRNASGFRVPF